jgi:mannose-1-phosphate guanylyltransferase
MKIVVFAGGVGTRLWPLSRKNSPKQFGKIVGELSTLQQAVERLLPEFEAADIYIATGEKYKDVVLGQLPTIPKENFIFEPTLQDVGPAIGLASILLEKKFREEPMAIIWSDHVVKNEIAFRHSLRLAEKQILNHQSKFVFIAQKPRFANQNCGWIELGEKIEENKEAEIFKFERLCYRPKPEEAEEFYKNKNFVWNLGYFVSTPKYIISLYKNYMPEMYEKLLQIQSSADTPDFQETLHKIYPTIEKISFDDAILVKLIPNSFRVIAADLGWSDVGTWDALKEALTEKKDENITLGDVLLENTKDTLLFNYSKKLCLGIDLNEIIVINTDDVLLVCPKNSVPKIKKIVEKLTGTEYENLV